MDARPSYSPYVAPGLLMLSLLIFIPTYGVGFVTDFLGWLNCYESSTSFVGVHQCFGVEGLYYIPLAILYAMTNLFGTAAFPWYVLFTGIHAVNAILLYRFIIKVGDHAELKLPMHLPLLSAVLFLVFPYQVEVIAWKACSNYLSAMMLMLLTLNAYADYIRSDQTKHLILALILYTVSLFNIEFTLMLPLILVTFHIVFDGPRWQNIRSTLPFFLIVALSVIINQFAFDRAVGHYELSTEQLNPIALGSTELQYLVKNVALSRFFPYQWQDKIYSILSTTGAGLLMILASTSLLLIAAFFRKRLGRTGRFRIFMFLSYCLLILPVSHLYFYYIQLSENDRYSYLALAFLAPVICSLLLSIKRVGIVLVLTYTILCTALSLYMGTLWHKSTSLHDNLVETFPSTDKDLYVLNVPDNYRGVFMFRNIGGESSIVEAVDHFSDIDHGRVVDVLQYNATLTTDGVNVQRISADTIRVEFNQWGNWWWRNGVGASNYSTETYRVRPNGKHYNFVDIGVTSDAVFLYYDGATWQTFDQ